MKMNLTYWTQHTAAAITFIERTPIIHLLSLKPSRKSIKHLITIPKEENSLDCEKPLSWIKGVTKTKKKKRKKDSRWNKHLSTAVRRNIVTKM